MRGHLLAKVESRPLPPIEPFGVSEMGIHVVDGRHVAGHTLWLRFSDGAEGEVDLGPELYGEVFEPLEDVAYFRTFRVHPELRTVVWPNGADFAPEFLRSSLWVAVGTAGSERER